MVPAKTCQLPLLPYEYQLIEALGISEEEYRWFSDEVRAGRLRPKGYEDVPDIQCIPIGVIISLVIGVLTSVVGMLLAPKANTSESKQTQNKTLPSQQGRTRFNNSVGFDAAPQLAQLGSRVPIIFGRYEEFEVDGAFRSGGGILAEPLLAWSRMLSNGSFQSLKIVAILGQDGIGTPPSLQGIFIGGQPVSNFYESNYAVFWRGISGDYETEGGRLYQQNLLYGKAAEGNGASGGIFTCPTLSGVLEPGFSMASSPANTASFGVYQSIPNGGNFRLNWRVISIPGGNDPGNRLQSERSKICGNAIGGLYDGMPGTGNPYSTKMGVVAVNGAFYNLPTVVTVSRGDRVVYRIEGGKYPPGEVGVSSPDVTTDDIDDLSDSARERVDGLLQNGEIFLCNRTLMRLIQRPGDPWLPGQTSEFTFEVISFTGANREIGVIGTEALQAAVLGDGKTVQPYYKGTGWYCLHKVDMGQFRNTRATEVTEIGIRSQVYERANGLCNFKALPTPPDLARADEDLISFSSPTMNKYMKRTSFFMLAVKDVSNIQGLKPGGEEISDDDDLFDGFDILGDVTFCIMGNTPVDQFNYIRIKSPAKKRYEFRLVPKCSTNIIRYESDQNQQIYVLTNNGEYRTAVSSSPYYGSFELSFSGDYRLLGDLFDQPEMRGPDKEFGAVTVCTAQSISHIGTVGHSGGGALQGFLEAVLGNLKATGSNSGLAVYGETRTGRFTTRFYSPGNIFGGGGTGGSVEVEVEAYVGNQGQEGFDRNGTAKVWLVTRWTIIGTSGTINDYQDFDTAPIPIGHTWFGSYFGLSTSVQRFKFSGIVCTQPPRQEFEREFEDNGAIKEISPYSEVTSSCDDSPEHEIVYVNESSNTPFPFNYYGLTTIGLKLRSQNQISSFQQLQVWIPNGISVKRLLDGQDGPSNNFADLVYWLLTTDGRSIGSALSDKLVDRDSFVKTARFLENTWCRFDGALSEQVNIREYLTQIAPLFLCNFAMKNGRFALLPALPVTESGAFNTGPVPIAQLFTDGNILEDTFELSYTEQGDRADFRAVMLYRPSAKNSLVEEESIMVKWAGEEGSPPAQEDFDMSNFCTRRGHAYAAARYMLSVRRRIDHVVKFSTLPQGLALSPGDYIRIDTTSSPFKAIANGVVRSDLSVLSASNFPDGIYRAFVYRQGSDGVLPEDVELKDGKVVDPTLENALLNIPSIEKRSGVYQIEELSLTEEGLVDITASHFPVDQNGSSLIVADVIDPTRFEVIE